MKTKVGRDMVKLRKMQKERFEEEPSGITFGTKIYRVNLNASQHLDIYIVNQTEKFRTGRRRKPALLLLNQSVCDNNFTDCPLSINMIATVYEMDKK
jgi:hypothetical protein